MHAYGVCPLPPAPQPRRAALPRLQFGNVAISSSYAQGFLRVRDGSSITTLGALRVLSERSAPACQNGSFAVS